MTLYEIVVLSVSLSIFAAYHTILYPLVLCERPTGIQLTLNIQVAKHWLDQQRSKEDPNSAMLAIHTLRNTIIVAVFVGGSTFSVGASFLDDISNGNFISEFQRSRAIILSTLLLGSFLMWVCVIRYSSYMGYTLSTLTFLSAVERERLIAEDTYAADLPVRASPAAPGYHPAGHQHSHELSAAQVADENKKMIRLIFLFTRYGTRSFYTFSTNA